MSKKEPSKEAWALISRFIDAEELRERIALAIDDLIKEKLHGRQGPAASERPSEVQGVDPE